MEKTQKRIFGFFGLVLVIAVTIFAAFLPTPKASAISTLTDTITVKVTGHGPYVDITIDGVKSGETTIDPTQTLSIDYSDIEYADVIIEYTNENGEKITKTLPRIEISDASGLINLPINFTEDEFGYGDYVVLVQGKGHDGTISESSIPFRLIPVRGDATKKDGTDDYELDLSYVADDGTDDAEGDVAEIKVQVYNEAGEEVPFSPLDNIIPPVKNITLPFGEYNLPAGKYTVYITAYDSEGNLLYEPYIIEINYDVLPVPDTGTPDTGGLFKNLNISNADYLGTGLVLFSFLTICGIYFVGKRGGLSKKR